MMMGEARMNLGQNEVMRGEYDKRQGGKKMMRRMLIRGALMWCLFFNLLPSIIDMME